MGLDQVCCFCFDEQKERVLLIRKKKPAWQNGFLNGIGGKIEPTDKDMYFATSREFQEETGLTIPETSWFRFAAIYGREFGRVNFFVGFQKLEFLQQHTSPTEEKVGLFDLDLDLLNVIPNLRYLIPMALQSDMFQHCVNILYKE